MPRPVERWRFALDTRTLRPVTNALRADRAFQRQQQRAVARFVAPAIRNARMSRLQIILLQEAWRIRLRMSGFHDLESAEDPDGPLSNAGQPSHLDKTDSVQVQHAAAYYRRIGQLARHFPFRRDADIAEMLADGAGIRSIKVKLGCGQGRIERVLRVIRAWIPGTKWAGEGGDTE